jgi:hypothetical protein
LLVSRWGSTVYGENNIGGFCGIINTSFASTTIERCYSNVSVYGNMNVGGFYGRSYIYDCRVDINECFSGGSVRATGDNVGGFYGINNSDKSRLIINKCCSIGYVRGNDYVGGFCGKSTIVNPNVNQIDSISDCFSTSSVSGNDYVGGFCGYEQINTKDDKVRINRCYSNGRVNGKKEGGFCAYQNNNYEENSYNYWDSEASMVSESFIAVGKSTNEMKTKTTFEAWDFTNIWDIDPYNNFGFPHLRDVPWGIMDEPILISIRDNHILNEIEPNFKWFHVYPATEYIFQISKTPTFDFMIIDTVLNDIEFNCNCALEYDYKYYWRVKALGSYESSDWSKVWSFEIKDFCIPGNYFSGKGKGTKESPFEISNICQLQEMKNDLDAYYKLVNDINGSDTKYWNFGDHDGYPYWFSPDSAMGFEPVGTYEEDNLNARFTGTFDGQGFTISDLFINRPIGNCIGLFGCISDESKINNVVIDHADITGKNSVGVLVGYVLSNKEGALIIIKDCSVRGKIGGCYDLGGMIGDILSFYGSVLINNCTSAVDIHRSHRYYDNNPWFYGIGGLIGSCVSWGDTIIIKKSHSTGSIFSTNVAMKNVGGFCGGTVSSGESKVAMVMIFDCYSTGGVFSENNDSWNIGGFCGENGAFNWDISYAIIENCYSTGDIILSNEAVDNYTENVGGFCGSNYSHSESDAIIINCYSTGNIFIKNKYFNTIGGFCGWNRLVADAGAGLLLIENCHSTGNVTCEGKEIVWVGGFCGSASIDFIYEKDYAFIKNCYSTGNVSGGIDNAGGFLGYNNIKIINCYSTGDVEGENEIGGFCGKNEYCIFDCYSKGDAKGVKAIGGFCGANELDNESSDIKSIIENCYSTGKAIGDTLVGGFCGLQSGDGKKEINNSYWDAKTS